MKLTEWGSNVVLAMLVSSSFACDRVGAEGREPAPTGARDGVVTQGNRSAVDGIAQARCDREQRCGNVGANQKYASREACDRAIRSEWRAELNAFDCPGGIVDDELAECMAEIRNEDCASPLDTLGRIVACRSSDICRAATVIPPR